MVVSVVKKRRFFVAIRVVKTRQLWQLLKS